MASLDDDPNRRRRAYFLGIAGAGMSALASILKSQGWEVDGSDKDVFPPMSDYLDAMAIPWRDGFDAALVPADLDIAIVGSSAKLDLATNPELAELRRRGAPIESFPAFLGTLAAGRDCVVVAGSFGKSTVTALLAHLGRAAGGDPGYFIGAAPLDLPAAGHGGTSPAFYMEGDEYVVGGGDLRSKFELYRPRDLLITSLVHDHVNAFPTLADYEAPFGRLIAGLPEGGRLVMARPFEALHRLAGRRPVVWYGARPGPGYHADAIEIGEVTRFDLVTPGGDRIPLATQLLGLHNIENLVGAAAMLLERGETDPQALRSGIRAFRGVERRLDRKTRRSRIPLYEGFGSSYEKARSAIEAVRLHFPARPLIVVFEPHAFSWRNRLALDWYATVFEGVARVLMLPPPGHGGDDQLAASEIVQAAAAAGVDVVPAPDGEAVREWLATRLRGDEVILLLSSGPLAGLPRSLPAYLDAHWAP